MRHKSDVEVQKAALLKSIRTAVRLKYSLRADEELNEVIPELEEKFDKAVSAGEPFGVDLESIYNYVRSRK